jgi:hypothetical protein
MDQFAGSGPITPLGRQEVWEDAPEGYPRPHRSSGGTGTTTTPLTQRPTRNRSRCLTPERRRSGTSTQARRHERGLFRRIRRRLDPQERRRCPSRQVVRRADRPRAAQTASRRPRLRSAGRPPLVRETMVENQKKSTIRDRSTSRTRRRRVLDFDADHKRPRVLPMLINGEPRCRESWIGEGAYRNSGEPWPAFDLVRDGGAALRAEGVSSSVAAVGHAHPGLRYTG